MKSVLAFLLVVMIGILAIDVLEPTYGFFGKVPTGCVGIATTFGKVHDYTLDSGFHFKNPFTKIIRMDVRTQKHSGTYSAFSSDIQQVDVGITINYNINKETAMNLFGNVGTNYAETLVMPRIAENTKVVISHYSAEGLVENREVLSNEIMGLMQADMNEYGITVTSVSIEDIDFTDAFTTAVENKQVATQEKLTAETEQARLTMEAEAEAQRKTIAAQANADQKKLDADAEAYAITAVAEAEANANMLISETLTEDLIDYTEASNWNGELPDTYIGNGDAIPVIQTGTVEAEDY